MAPHAPRSGILLLTAVLTAALAACGDTEPVAETPAPSPGTTTAAPVPTTVPTTPAAAATVDKQITVTIARKKIDPPTHRIQVGRGDAVRVTVTSDVADQLHIHGYDLKTTLPAGEPASIDFTADKTGLFEVETHESDLVLFQLLVR